MIDREEEESSRLIGVHRSSARFEGGRKSCFCGITIYYGGWAVTADVGLRKRIYIF